MVGESEKELFSTSKGMHLVSQESEARQAEVAAVSRGHARGAQSRPRGTGQESLSYCQTLFVLSKNEGTITGIKKVF